MSADIYAKIRANPKYQQLVSKRSSYGWVLTILMMIVYYGFIAVIAFDKSLLAQPLSATGVTTVGIPIGAGVIVFTILITGLYVRRANTEFDAIKEEVIREAK